MFLVFHKPLGRLGASVLGIDPVEDSINTAQVHTSYDPELRGRVRYQACTLEELSAEEEGEAGRFDAVVASEVVEHLADLETFAFCCNHMLKVCPGIIHDLVMFVCYRIILASLEQLHVNPAADNLVGQWNREKKMFI